MVLIGGWSSNCCREGRVEDARRFLVRLAHGVFRNVIASQESILDTV
jgi:hypothetical protein